jgi:signal transduction histidine kinase
MAHNPFVVSRLRWVPLIGLPGVVLAVGLTSLHRNAGIAPVSIVLAVVAVLLVRTRAPVAALSVVCALVAVVGLVHDPPTLLPAALVAVLAVAERRRWPVVAAAAGLAAGAVFGGAILAGSRIDAAPTLAVLASFAAVSVFGLWWQARASLRAESSARVLQAERERELVAERGLVEERARIARELHDVIAHHVGLLVVQAGSLQATMPADHPDRGLVESMAATGREALAEMRRLVGLLRPLDEVAERTPQPGLADLASLAERAQMSGLDLELVVEGAPRPLPAGIDLSAYRIVQEAVTNALRHAGSAHTQVLVRYRPDGLELLVEDDGGDAARANHAPEPGEGRGLAGMRERVAMLGGELVAAPSAAGGFAVHALLPTDPNPV